jgi:thioredoxin reductase (NADPH)
MQEETKVLIIGGGPAGYTAAIYASRAGLNPILYQGEAPGGQLMLTTDVENYPGYPQGVLGPQMMEDFRTQAALFGTDIRTGHVTAAKLGGYPHQLTVDGKHHITAQTVIIATGATAKWLGLPSEKKLQGRGVSSCAVCDGFFFKEQDVAIVGGGDSATEEALYLAGICRKVHLIVRRDVMRASQIMQERVKRKENITILFNTTTQEILGDEEVTGVRVKNKLTEAEEEYSIQGFFVAIGHTPNTSLFSPYITCDASGYIKTLPGTAKTNVAGVFAAGDVADPHYRQAITAAATGCMAALDAERFLLSKT